MPRIGDLRLPTGRTGHPRRRWFPMDQPRLEREVRGKRYRLFALMRRGYATNPNCVDPTTGVPTPRVTTAPSGKRVYEPFIHVMRDTSRVRESPGWVWRELSVESFMVILRHHNLTMLYRAEDDPEKVPKPKLAYTPEFAELRRKYKMGL